MERPVETVQCPATPGQGLWRLEGMRSFVGNHAHGKPVLAEETISRAEELSAGLVRAEIDLAVAGGMAVVRSREITGEVFRQR